MRLIGFQYGSAKDKGYGRFIASSVISCFCEKNVENVESTLPVIKSLATWTDRMMVIASMNGMFKSSTGVASGTKIKNTRQNMRYKWHYWDVNGRAHRIKSKRQTVRIHDVEKICVRLCQLRHLNILRRMKINEMLPKSDQPKIAASLDM